jgi:hypothetical protein
MRRLEGSATLQFVQPVTANKGQDDSGRACLRIIASSRSQTISSLLREILIANCQQLQKNTR